MSLFARKPLEKLLNDAGTDSLKRTLGPAQLVALGIGAIIGAGLFSLTGIAASQNAGPAVVLSFILAAVGCAFAGLCYSEFATMIPIAGSAYTYAYATMGEIVAWIIGWDLVLEYAVGAATVGVSWSKYVMSFFHDFGINFPAQLAASPFEPVTLPETGEVIVGLINLPALFVICLISWLLIVGIQESARVNAVIVALKVTVVLVFIWLGWAYINPDNFTPFIPENTGEFGAFGWSGILRGAGLVFFAFIGFDAVSTAAQEAKNPQKDMPIGIIGSLAACTILYVLFAHVLTGIVHFPELNSAAPVAVAIDKTDYRWLRPAIKLAIIAGYTCDPGDAVGAEPCVLLHVARRAAAEVIQRRASEVPHAVALKPVVHGGHGAAGSVCANPGIGRGDQHRHIVRIRAGVRRHHDHAQDASGTEASVQDAVGAAGADSGNPVQPGPDGGLGLDQLGPAVRVDGDRLGDLLQLQPQAQHHARLKVNTAGERTRVSTTSTMAVSSGCRNIEPRYSAGW